MLRPVMLALLGTSFTFLMTALGAATVFFFARKVCERAQGALLGFAAGVMMAASVHRWRRRLTGRPLTLRLESVGSKQD